MLQVNFKLSKAWDTLKMAKVFKNGVWAAASLAVRYVLEEMQNQIKINLAGKILRMRSGDLMQAWSGPIKIDSVVGDDVVSGRLVPQMNLPHLAIHEFGSEGLVAEVGPRGGLHADGRIYPIRAKMLRWVGDDGVVRFAKSIKIPPRRYFSLAYKATKSKAKGAVSRAISDANKGMTGANGMGLSDA